MKSQNIEPHVLEVITAIGSRAREAALKLGCTSTAQRNQALEYMAAELEAAKDKVLQGNARDMERGRAGGLSEAMLDRLLLTEARYASMVAGLRDLIKLPDPVGASLGERRRPNGLLIQKVRVPIGVIGIIYESRPNVTADAAGLCVKTGNAVILRGGKEAKETATPIAEALRLGAARAGLPADSIQLVDLEERSAVYALARLEQFVDLIIPRGGESLIRAVTEVARVPVLKHYKGVCHIYVDKSADLETALNICDNAKCQRPGVCNAMETLLVDRCVAGEFLPRLAKRLTEAGVELRADDAAREVIPTAKAAEESDWSEEYLDLTLAIRLVDGVNQAVAHINTYGSRHTDAILAQDPKAQQLFSQMVDTGVLMINASTRFNDGAEFGLGAEMGISTDKLHARGPVGPEELTTYKYIVIGEGQIRG